MITKYLATTYSNEIKCVEVERETVASVWANGRRLPKRSSYENYFETWQGAHGFLRESAETELSQAQGRVDRARSKLEFVKKLKPII